MARLHVASPIGMALLAVASVLALSACPSRDRGISAPAPEDMPYGDTSGASGNDAVMHWQCGDLRVSSRFDPSPAAVQLWWSGRNATLPQAMAASGARYAGAGHQFWSKGDTARLTLAGGEARDCARTDVASPWFDAARRGIAFRAAGNEPGWWVEVDGGAAPTIRAELDYGERRIGAMGRATDDGFAGETADGTAVALSIRREPCSDGMSGEAFEATAELRVGERMFTGCGAYLAE